MVRRRLVTLTSDLGSAYAAQMKAVLAREIDPGRVVDLSHDLPAHSVGEAAFLFRAMARGFPAGSVHVAVVDPGVGGRRAPIAIECREGSFLIGPDNGLLFPLAEELGMRSAVRLEPRRFTSAMRVGTTFDGRDVFAPAAGRLAQGWPLSRLGHRHPPRPFRLPVARRIGNGGRGVVLHVDRFGNLITNVPSEWVPGRPDRVRGRVGRRRWGDYPWVSSYETLGAGRAGLLGSSFGTIEVAVGQGRANERLRARVGDPAAFVWPRPTPAKMTVNSTAPRHR